MSELTVFAVPAGESGETMALSIDAVSVTVAAVWTAVTSVV